MFEAIVHKSGGNLSKWTLMSGNVKYSGAFYSHIVGGHYIDSIIYSHSSEIVATVYRVLIDFNEELDHYSEMLTIPLPSKKGKALYKLKKDKPKFVPIYGFIDYIEAIYNAHCSDNQEFILYMETFVFDEIMRR